MYLHKLTLSNFKNYRDADLAFSPKINCFVGNNGVGKTNLLDAIHYLSFCKSYFNPVDSQNIRHNGEFFAIHGFYDKNGNKEDKLSCIQRANHKKQFKLNKKEYGRLSDHIGLYPLVMISPYDRDLINEGSDIRRKYIDSVISQFDKVYLDCLIGYNKALVQRNTLLKDFYDRRYFDPSALDIWDEKLIELGHFIHGKRQDFIRDFTPLFLKYFELISGGMESVDIRYASQLSERDLDQLLAVSREKDRAVKHTTAGVHKDDLEFMIDGFPVKKFGSQGQQKSFVIAIKLAQFEYTRNRKGFKPILLFDDIFDKLDENRVEQLVELVSLDSFGQVFITDTQKRRIEHIFHRITIDHKIFEVMGGVVTEIPNNPVRP
ncbi:MAG: DNA replication/repair protein RecF [Bacteroidales bacterium]